MAPSLTRLEVHKPWSRMVPSVQLWHASHHNNLSGPSGWSECLGYRSCRPAYASHTTSRVLRRSSGLFDEWKDVHVLAAAAVRIVLEAWGGAGQQPQDAPAYGDELLVVVRDLALDKKDPCRTEVRRNFLSVEHTQL